MQRCPTCGRGPESDYAAITEKVIALIADARKDADLRKQSRELLDLERLLRAVRKQCAPKLGRPRSEKKNAIRNAVLSEIAAGSTHQVAADKFGITRSAVWSIISQDRTDRDYAERMKKYG